MTSGRSGLAGWSLVCWLLTLGMAQGSVGPVPAQRLPFTLIPPSERWEVGLSGHLIGTLRRAAEQGDPEAQYDLGVLHERGEGMPVSLGEAERWYRLAAEQGFAMAQYNLGVLCIEGEGVRRRDGEGVKWFRLAAEQGMAEAQFNLGVMYQAGRGVTRDVTQAYAWIALAASGGIEQAGVWLVFLERVMTAQQRLRARRLVENWQPVQVVDH
ncbi:MAG: sel1 repeat family protein [Magnetococcales bacterium]|nr:sel1 repeat family protein [Magnetococcales bacterium]